MQDAKEIRDFLGHFGNDFEKSGRRIGQLNRCKGLFEHFRSMGPFDTPEAKKLAKMVIRSASESAVDHRLTVDFTTRKALRQIQTQLENLTNSKPKPFKSKILLKKFFHIKALVHEHMVPCEATFTAIEEGWLPISMLHEASFRALVDKDEDKRLNVNRLKESLPECIRIGPYGSTCPAIALSRYCASGLIQELISLNEHSRALIERRSQQTCGSCEYFA